MYLHILRSSYYNCSARK